MERDRGVVVAQLVGQSLLAPEFRGSNPAFGQIYVERLLSTVLKFEKAKRKEKRGLKIEEF